MNPANLIFKAYFPPNIFSFFYHDHLTPTGQGENNFTFWACSHIQARPGTVFRQRMPDLLADGLTNCIA